jgi:hypothetical protein
MGVDIDEATRAEVSERAAHRCEYCLIHENDVGFPHQIDHIISRKHGGGSESNNLALACMICNRHKGSDIASIDRESGQILPLFHPRNDVWTQHFRIAGEIIEPLTSVGSVTALLLRLNSPERLRERRLLQAVGSYPSA